MQRKRIFMAMYNICFIICNMLPFQVRLKASRWDGMIFFVISSILAYLFSGFYKRHV